MRSFEQYMREAGGNADSAFYAVLADMSEVAKELKAAKECQQVCPGIPQEMVEEIIEKAAAEAAEKALKQVSDGFYQSVGQNVVSKFFWVVGISALGIWAYFKGMGVV